MLRVGFGGMGENLLQPGVVTSVVELELRRAKQRVKRVGMEGGKVMLAVRLISSNLISPRSRL